MNDWRSIPIEITNQLMQKFKKMNEENTMKFQQYKQSQLIAEQIIKEEKETLIKRKKELEQIHNLQTQRLNTELIECRKKELLHIQTIEKLRNDLERKSNINELSHQENFQKLHEQYQQFLRQHNDCEDIKRQFIQLQQNQFQLQNTIQNLQSENTKLNKDLQFQKQLSKNQQEQSKEQNQIINSLKANNDQLRDRNKEIVFKQHLTSTAKSEVQYRSVDLKQEDKQQKNQQIIQQLTQRIKDLEQEQHAKLEAMQSEYQIKINNLQKTLLQIKKEAQDLEGLMNDRDAQLSIIQSDSEQQLKQLHHLEQKLLSVEQDQAQKNNQLLEQNNLIDLLKFEKSQFQNKIEELTSAIQLQQIVDDSQNQNESQPIDIELIQNLKQQLIAAQETNDRLTQQLKTNELEKQKLEETHQEQQQIAVNFLNQIKEFQDIIEVKDQMVFNNQAECDLQIQKLESEHSMKQEWLDLQIQEQTEQIEQMEETIKQLKLENQELSKTIEKQNSSIEQQNQQQNNNDKENYQKELEKLKELLEQKDQIIFTNQSESDLKFQKAESEFQMKLQWADLSSQEMNEQIAELEVQNKLLQSKLSDQTQQQSKSLNENSDQIATLNGELILLKFKCKELEDQCLQLQNHNSELQRINNDNDQLEVETILENKQLEISSLQQQLEQKQQQLKQANDKYLNLELKFNLQTQDFQSQIEALKQLSQSHQQVEKSDTAEYYEKINRLLLENEEFKNLQSSNYELKEELTHKDQLISELQIQMLSQSQVTGEKDLQQRQKTQELLTKLKDDQSDVSVGSLKSAKSRKETQELFKKITKLSMYTAHYMSSKLDYASLDQQKQGEQEPIEEESIQQEYKQQQQQQQEDQI